LRFCSVVEATQESEFPRLGDDKSSRAGIPRAVAQAGSSMARRKVSWGESAKPTEYRRFGYPPQISSSAAPAFVDLKEIANRLR